MENPMTKTLRRAALITAAFLAAVAAGSAVQAQTNSVTPSVNEQLGANKAAAASQTRINGMDDETQRMLGDYRATLRETESLRRYNEQLEIQIKSQEQEMASINEQISEIEHTNREIYPLMQRMIETIDKFVQLDVPFNKPERVKRVQALKEIMTRADVSTAEKFRRILEAYTVEMEFGRTLEAYEDKLGEGDAARTVNFLRIGRVALLYQTLDADETGYWDTDKKDWVKDNGYKSAVKDGLKIARKQKAPDLLIAPVHAPEVAAAQETK
jgi:hypothetical protein